MIFKVSLGVFDWLEWDFGSLDWFLGDLVGFWLVFGWFGWFLAGFVF